MMRPVAVMVFLGTLIVSAGCSDSPKAETTQKPPEKPAEPVTGRVAFQNMYPPARQWAVDAQPIRLQSLNLQEVKSDKGKAGAWQGVFVSMSAGKSKSWSYSVVEASGNLHKGVFAGPQESWSGPTGQSSPFEFAAIKIDSDEAYSVAAEKSAEYIKKNPDKPVTFLLERNSRFPDPTWRVIWGESVGTSDYSVFVDASTGKFLETLH